MWVTNWWSAANTFLLQFLLQLHLYPSWLLILFPVSFWVFKNDPQLSELKNGRVIPATFPFHKVAYFLHKVTVAPLRVKKISSLDNNLFSFHDIRDTIKQFPTRSLKYYTFIQLILWKKLSQPKSAKLVFHFTCRTNLHVDRPINLKVRYEVKIVHVCVVLNQLDLSLITIIIEVLWMVLWVGKQLDGTSCQPLLHFLN